MDTAKLTMAQQVAQAVIAFHQQTTGRAPKAVTVVLSEDTLVVTLHEALSPAEKNMAKSPAGAAQVQEFHRQLFSNSSQSLRDEIKRITGVAVREAVAEVEPMTGAMVQAFTSGTLVQVFQLTQGVSEDTWNKKSGGRLKPLMILGIVLIILGGLGLIFNQDISHRLSYTSKEKVVDVGGLQVTADTEKPFPISAIAGGLLLAGGIVAVVAAVKKG